MAAEPSPLKVIENIQVAPPPESVSTTTLPLTFFDIPFVSSCPPVQRILFYELPDPRLHFTQSVLPGLRQSLSQTLRQFFPFAAKLVCPQPPYQPSIIYSEGDAIQVIIAETDYDFNYLVANHARDIKQLKSLVAKLPFASLSSNATNVVPIMAMQFTVFPNSGLSIGVTFNHAVADGRSIDHFMKFWASIHRSQGREDLTTSLSLPYCTRDIIKDPDGLSATLLKDLQSWEDSGPVANVTPDNVLVTLVINRVKIDQLKNWVASQITDDEVGQLRISTFVVVYGFMWVKLMKLQEQITGYLDDNMDYHFVFAADCRERFEFPIPKTYFGNCLTHYLVSAKRRELMGESGVVVAAKAIGRKVCELDKGAFIGTGKWLSDLNEIFQHGRLVMVSRSPKFRVYETDFGWGKPKKFEIVHFSACEFFSFIENREDDGAVDIGVVVGRDKLDHFNTVFDHSLYIH